jgi:hypothetical protein
MLHVCSIGGDASSHFKQYLKVGDSYYLHLLQKIDYLIEKVNQNQMDQVVWLVNLISKLFCG